MADSLVYRYLILHFYVALLNKINITILPIIPDIYFLQHNIFSADINFVL